MSGLSDAPVRGSEKQPNSTLSQDDTRDPRLPMIHFVCEVGAWRPKRKAVNLVPQLFDRLDLPSDERMADRRVEIAQIGEAHSHSAFD